MMKVSIILVGSVMLICYKSTLSQGQIQGTIKDKITRQPVIDVTVSIQSLKVGTTTDLKGFYQIRNIPYGTYALQVNLIGYNKIQDTVVIEGEAVKNYEIEKSTIPSKEVIVVGSQEGTAEDGYRTPTAQIGLFGNLSAMDAPYAINTTPGELIENRGAHNLTSALQTNPTAVVVQLLNNDGAGTAEVNLRGFDAVCMQDGLIVNSYLAQPVEDVERIEVMNGFPSYFYGFQSIGGTINFITKPPSATPLAKLSLGHYNGGVNFIHADLGGPLDKNQQLIYRMNVYGDNGETYIQDASQRRNYFATAIEFQPWIATTLKARISHQDVSYNGQQTLFVIDPTKGIKIPSESQFDATVLYGQPWTYVKGRQEMMGLSFASRLSDFIIIRGAYQYVDFYRKNRTVSATLTDNNGNYAETYSMSAPVNTLMQSSYVLCDANFTTGTIHHDLTFGYTGNVSLQMNNPTNISKVALGKFNIDHPRYIAIPDTASPSATIRHQTRTYNSFLIGDRIALTNKAVVTAGVSYHQFKYDDENTATGIVSADYKQSKLTPSIALTIKPNPNISTYASYMQGLVAGGSTTTAYAKNVNELLSPSTSDQYELGMKANTAKIDFSSAVYYINKINEYLDLRDSVYKQEGREIHKGIEFSVTGKIFEGLIFVGGYNYIDAKYEKQANNPAQEGKTPTNVPRDQVRVYLEYALPGMPGLSISGSVAYTGERPADNTNINFLPSTAIFNAGIRYEPTINEHLLSFNLHIENVFNTTYWASYKPTGTIGLGLGAPRVISISSRIEL